MTQPRVGRSRLYTISGTLLLSLGLLLGARLGTRILADAIQSQVESRADYLVVAAAPAVALPPARSISQPQATPTAAPLPQTPVRVVIPAIRLNSSVVGVQAERVRLARGQERWKWTVADYAVGHHISSGKLGEDRNIVLTGHNNTRGEVFRHLPDLQIGDSVIIFSADREHRYTVTERAIVPYRRDRVNGERTIKAYSAPTPGERVTLISCYPYVTNADRIVIVAKPDTDAEQRISHDF